MTISSLESSSIPCHLPHQLLNRNRNFLGPPRYSLSLVLKDCLVFRIVLHIVRGHPFMTSTRRGGGGQALVDACGRGRNPAPCGCPHRKLKLESTDFILSP